MLCDLMDVDKFLTKADFMMLADINNMSLRWPWRSIHFIQADYCFGCGFSITSDETKPRHFIVTDENVILEFYFSFLIINETKLIFFILFIYTFHSRV